MKARHAWLVVLVAAAAAGCGGSAPEPAPQAVAKAPLPRYDFGPKSPIPVRLTLRATSEGGRVAPLHGGYRPDVVFDAAADAAPTTCSIGGAASRGFAPGETREVVLRCAKRVSVRPDATGFMVRDGEQVVGRGVVLP